MVHAPPVPGIDLRVYTRFLEALPDPAFILGPDGKVVIANADAERVTGYGRQIVGQQVTALIAEPFHEGHPLLRRGTGDVRASYGKVQLELRMVRKGGVEVPVELTLSPFDGDAPKFVLAVVHEVADKGEAGPAEVQRLKEMAEFRARFLNIAAHELKTPLTPIRLQIQILQSYLADSPSHVTGSMSVLARSVDRLHTLIDDVLDAARIQASRLRLRQDPVSLSSAVAEAMDSYGPVAEHVGVHLETDINSDVVVIGDHGRLLQILNNLLSNAVKFTPSGGHVNVYLGRAGESALLRVSDSGRGMTAEQISRLFQPFAQVHPDLEATQKGSGLGLYITKGIVEQHGGTIEVNSEGDNQGTAVTVRLPTTTQKPIPDQPYRASRRQQQLSSRLREMV